MKRRVNNVLKVECAGIGHPVFVTLFDGTSWEHSRDGMSQSELDALVRSRGAGFALEEAIAAGFLKPVYGGEIRYTREIPLFEKEWGCDDCPTCGGSLVVVSSIREPNLVGDGEEVRCNECQKRVGTTSLDEDNAWINFD